MKTTLVALATAATAMLLGAAPKPEILVFGAASLTESLQDLGKAFEEKTGVHVVFSFGASSDLQRQIEAGAPADVFFSADTAKMDNLEKAGFVASADRREFLSNRLVVVVPKNSTQKVASAADLEDLPKIALADPAAVPVGIYAKKWLTGLGLWEKIEPRVVPTLDVRAALAAVESEAVSVAVVYRTDAAIAKNVKVAFEVKDGPQIVYSVAALSKSRNRAQAEAFVQFLAGETGRAEFERGGFLIRDRK